MKNTIILLLLAVCISAFPHFEGPKSPVIDNDIVPGPMLGFGAGYDVVYERVRAPMYQFTYQYGQNWINPYNNKDLAVPDQVYLSELPEGRVVVDQVTISHWDEYIKTITSTVGVSVGMGISTEQDLAKVSFQRSHSEMDQTIQGGFYNFGLENRFLPFYQLDMWPDSEVSQRVTAMLDALPSTVENDMDRNQYRKTIQGFGTHVITSAQFGGFINMTSVFNSSMYEHHEKSWVQTQVGIALTWNEINLGIDTARNKSMEHNQEDFEENSYSDHSERGGNAYVMETEGYNNWLPTIYDMPAIVPKSLILTPLHYYITDPEKSETMRQQLEDYILNP